MAHIWAASVGLDRGGELADPNVLCVKATHLSRNWMPLIETLLINQVGLSLLDGGMNLLPPRFSTDESFLAI